MLCNAIWLVSAGPGTDGTSSAFYVDLGMLFQRIISIDKTFHTDFQATVPQRLLITLRE